MAGIPQVITEDRASGAQVVEGSLKFDLGNYNRLQRTQVGGNRKTFTWSGWIKNTDTFVNTSDSHDWFSANEGNTTGGVDYGFGVRFPYNKAHSTHPHQLMVFEYENSAFKLRLISEQTFLDLSQFYHLVIAVDTTIASPSSDRVKVYVNGERITAWKSGYEQYPTQNLELTVNESGKTSHIGCSFSDGSSVVQPADGFASNFYLIDGQQLGPEEFGFTDPLTNTWRPKKYNVSKADTVLVGSPTYASSDFKTEGNKTSDQTSLSFGSWTSGSYTGAETKIFKNSTDTAFKLNVGLVGGTTDRLLWYSDNLTDWTFVGNTNPSRNYQLSGHKYYATSEGSGSTTLHATADGHNSFYLPMDGNTPIGKDQSGNGNDFTPKRFGGSVDLPKATGALPILNTNDAGTVAKFGVRTDKKTYTVTASGGNYYLDGALKPTLNAYRGGTYTFDYTGATSHPFYLSSLPDGKHNSKAYSVNLNGVTDYLTVPDSTDFAFGTNDFTIELFFKPLSLDTSYSVSSYAALIDNGYGSSGGDVNGRWFVLQQVNTQIYTGIDGGQSYSGGGLTGEWQHLALVRHGLTTTTYLDGVSIGSRTATTKHDYSDNLTRNLTIGLQAYSTGRFFKGDISNVRIVNGTALYTSNFTPPWTTLTNVTNTKLLCCQDSNATTGAVLPTGATITANGNAAANNTSPFLYNTNGELGVNTGTSNITKITIPHHAADTLYYYCNAHSGMGSSINVTTDIFKADPYAWKCTLALPCLGNAEDVSHLINCNTTELPIVPQANAHADFSTGNFYGGSYDLDGSGDYINVNSSSPYSHVNFGYSDYTAECWVYLDGTGDEYVFNMSTNNGGAAPHWNINFYSTNLIRAGRTDGNGNSRHQITYDFPRNKWMHIAISRGGFTSKLFLDGVLIDSRFDDDGIVPIGNLNIGAYNNGGAELNGFVQDARIYNGVAKYTESFVVGSTAPDVLPDSPSGITGKSKLTKITDGAVYLGGSPDELTLADSDDFNFGSGEFTVEAFVEGNIGGNRTGSVILNQSTGGASSDSAFYFGCGNNGASLYLSTSGSSWTNYIEVGSNRITRSGWHHVVWQRRGNLLEIYIDGIKQAVASGSNSGDAAITGSVYNSSRPIEIGPQNNSGYYVGHISNLRVIKGTALYTSNFTPPTETLTTTSQGATASEVKLLCCQSPTSATAAAVTPGSITANGDAAATNFNPFTDDINTIRGQETGYATMNPLTRRSEVFLKNGNLDVEVTSGLNSWDARKAFSTIGVDSGKWYAEMILGANSSSYIAICGNTENINETNSIGWQSQGWGYYSGGILVYQTNELSSGIPAYTTGDVVAAALDVDNSKVKFYKNGVQVGNSAGMDITPGLTWFFAFDSYDGTTASWNFGQKPFKFPPPDGFQPLSLSTVQPEKVIARPDQYVGVSLWTGNGTSQTISGLKHKPDLVWSKARSFGADHELYDSVRGTMKRLYSSLTTQEGTPSSGVNSFNADGFGVTGGGGVNNNTSTYVGWTWKAGGNKNTFNIDDVGYANASDVNMNVGGLNSSTYDQSQNWTNNVSSTSNITSGHEARLFNGILSGSNADIQSNQGTSGVINFTSAITGSKIEIYTIGNVGQIGINGSNLSVTANQWVDTGVTSLTSVETRHPGAGSIQNPTGLKVDGKILVDSGVSVTNVPSIAATGCSVGTKQGFSIIKWQGDGSDANRTVPHGLLEAPSFIIVKPLTEARHWLIWHKDYNDDDAAALFTTAPPAGSRFGPQAPTSSVFGVYGGQGNRGTTDFIGYCWHDVPGLQKFGSYESNSGGVFVELGFKPAILVIKNIDATLTNSQWNVVDTKRDTYNEMFNNLAWDRSNGEPAVSATTYGVDIFSNGFHIPSGNTGEAINNTNGGADTYIYMAWAEAPSINLYGAQSNAF